MTRIDLEELVAIVGGDRDLIAILIRERVISTEAEGFELRDVDRVLAARTLVRELDIDAGAVELILHLREQLAAARRELARYRALLDERGDGSDR